MSNENRNEQSNLFDRDEQQIAPVGSGLAGRNEVVRVLDSNDSVGTDMDLNARDDISGDRFVGTDVPLIHANSVGNEAFDVTAKREREIGNLHVDSPVPFVRVEYPFGTDGWIQFHPKGFRMQTPSNARGALLINGKIIKQW